MAEIKIQPKGVCCREVIIQHEDGLIKEVKFIGGCAGNTQGVARLLVGRRLDETSDLLLGIRCRGSRNGETSCPDQLAKGIKEQLG
jgi:uncharacterized protein (TIGR03905 family)